MCTLTWHCHRDGYRLLFTRDELRSRARARPPAIRFLDGIAHVAPTDVDRGGTWIGVNEFGVTHCIVNTFGGPIGRGLREQAIEIARLENSPTDPNVPRPSRGQLVRHLQQSGSVEFTEQLLHEWPVDRVPDFCIIQFGAHRDPVAFLKEGSALYRSTVNIPPVTTSGYRPDVVERFRFDVFDRVANGERLPDTRSAVDMRRTLARCHEFRHRADPALGIRMVREDGRSVSLTAVEVDSGDVSMGYREIPERGAVRAMRTWRPRVSIGRRPARSRTGCRSATHSDTSGERVIAAQPGTVSRKLSETKEQSGRIFDVRRLFSERSPKLAGRLPPGTFALLESILHAELLNRFIPRFAHMETAEFCEYVLERLDIRLHVEGLEHLQTANGRPPVFCSNHPTGAIEGVALIALLKRRFGSVLLPANEILARVPPLEPVMVPIDRYRGNAAVAGIYAKAFASDAPVLVFPAGRTARVRGEKLREFDWTKSFVTYARRNARAICPVSVTGRNSILFYTIYRIRRAFGLKLNLEMMLLVDELLRSRGTTRTIRFGPLCDPEKIEGGNDWQRAATLRKSVERNI